jgi:DNA-binding MltR family transcriptional regulator
VLEEQIRSNAETIRQPDTERSAYMASRGKVKKAMGKSSKFELSDEEFNAAIYALTIESDRGAAILGAALVEDGLRELLRSVIVNHNDDDLFNGRDALFKTLHSKTIAVHALGLCDKEYAKDIDTIRSIRNDFAHELQELKFSQSPILDKCRKLDKYRKNNKVKMELDEKNKERDTFKLACLDLWLRLTVYATTQYQKQLEQIKREPPANILRLINVQRGLKDV